MLGEKLEINPGATIQPDANIEACWPDVSEIIHLNFVRLCLTDTSEKAKEQGKKAATAARHEAETGPSQSVVGRCWMLMEEVRPESNADDMHRPASPFPNHLDFGHWRAVQREWDRRVRQGNSYRQFPLVAQSMSECNLRS